MTTLMLIYLKLFKKQNAGYKKVPLLQESTAAIGICHIASTLTAAER